MTEDGHSVGAKDNRTATQTTSPPTSSAAPLPWSAEEQKVELKNFTVTIVTCFHY